MAGTQRKREVNHEWFLDEPSGRAERDRTHHKLNDLNEVEL